MPKASTAACSADVETAGVPASQGTHHSPDKGRSSRATPGNRHEPVHRAVPKAGLTIPKLVEQRCHRRLERGDDVVVSCFLASPYRHQYRVQEVESGQKNLRKKKKRCTRVPLSDTTGGQC